MTQPAQSNEEQFKLWNGHAGRAWVEMQDVLDRMFAPMEDLLVTEVARLGGGRLLDVGCGTGGTTLAMARRLGEKVRCTGLDISVPMIAHARLRAGQEGLPVQFVAADAQSHAFEPASFDVIVSRFGVMFFDDFIRAFANLRRAASDGGMLRALVWRSAAQNPYMTAAEHAVAPLLPELPVRRLDGPGQFAFADPERVTSMLHGSGWAGVDIQPVDVACALPEADLMRYVHWMGPVGVAMQKVDEATRALVVDAVRAAYQPFTHDGDVRFMAACWLVSARAA